MLCCRNSAYLSQIWRLSPFFAFGLNRVSHIGGKALQVFAIFETSKHMTEATGESIRTHRARPIVKQTVREAGGWGGAAFGAELGAGLGAMMGIETGPGAILTGLVGGMVGGTVGYFGGDYMIEAYYAGLDMDPNPAISGSRWVPQGLKSGPERYQTLQGYMQMGRDLSGDRYIYDENGVRHDPFEDW